VQDAWVRWQAYDRDTVRDPTAFLVTMTTRLALTATRTARARRETYVGPWLPVPVDTGADPALGAERGAALETAVLPTTEANARQLVSRARRHVGAQRQQPVDAARHRRLLAMFRPCDRRHARGRRRAVTARWPAWSLLVTPTREGRRVAGGREKS
jgi:RNA polymerase sigma-70 factor (ECF subfamily)